ncbi:MAG: DUF4340 domain-containing protein [Planctomycetes bacterium]|nr:DUF4340 domain-containing protein [Planctomycetota bacterium]
MSTIPRVLKPWLAALALVALGWLLRSGAGTANEPQLLAEIPVDLVSKIEARKAGRTLVFERIGDAWMQTSPVAQPADPAAIRRALVAMAEARVIQATDLLKMPARAGLDESAPSLKATWPTGSATLRIGARHPAGLAWIAAVERNIGGPGSSDLHRMLVEGDPVQLRSARLFDRPGAASDRVIVQANSGAKRLEVALEKKEGRWSLVEPIEARADNGAVADFLEAVARLEHEGIVDDEPKDLALYGLATPAAVVSIRSLDLSKGVSVEEVLEIGSDGPAGPGGRFGKRRDRPGVFQLEKRSLSALFPPSAAFIDATMLGVDPAEVASIELRGASGTPRAELARSVATWRIKEPASEARPADPRRIRELLQALCAARASDLATEAIPPNLVVAHMTARLSGGAAIALVIGKDAQGRWLVGDGGNLTRVYPATMSFPLEPEMFGSSNR